jgi:hypothetical protein
MALEAPLLPAHPTPTVSASHAALAVTIFWDVYSPPSDLICYLSVEHGDEFFAETHVNHLFLAERSPYSPEYVEEEFCEVPPQN